MDTVFRQIVCVMSDQSGSKIFQQSIGSAGKQRCLPVEEDMGHVFRVLLGLFQGKEGEKGHSERDDDADGKRDLWVDPGGNERLCEWAK